MAAEAGFAGLRGAFQVKGFTLGVKDPPKEKISILTTYGPPLTGFKRPRTQMSLTMEKLSEILFVPLGKPVSTFHVLPGLRDTYLDTDLKFPEGAIDVTGWYVLSPPREYFKDPLLEKIGVWMNDFFEGRPRLACDLKERAHLLCEIANVCTRNIGFENTLLPEEFTDEALEILGISNRKDLAELSEIFKRIQPYFTPQKLPCYIFALLRAKEPGVADYLSYLSFKSRVGCVIVENDDSLLELLPKWGYVTVLEPKVGDLVMYLNNGVPKHLGRYIGEGRAESKPGGANSCFAHHPLEAVFPQYGDQILIWRKEKEGTYSTSLSKRLAANLGKYGT